MKLPKLKITMIPDSFCIRCGQHGYIGEKSCLCLGCLNIALLRYSRKRKEESHVSASAEVPDPRWDENAFIKKLRANLRIHIARQFNENSRKGSQ
jgi:hypothetical protein